MSRSIIVATIVPFLKCSDNFHPLQWLKGISLIKRNIYGHLDFIYLFFTKILQPLKSSCACGILYNHDRSMEIENEFYVTFITVHEHFSF